MITNENDIRNLEEKKENIKTLSTDEYYTKAHIDALLAQKEKEINKIRRRMRYGILAALISLACLIGFSSLKADAEPGEGPLLEPGFAIYTYDEYGNVSQVKPDSIEGWGDKLLYFDEHCVPTFGWKYHHSHWYYFREDFVKCEGWQKMDGKWYFFSSGVAYTGLRKVFDGGNNYYYFSDTGVMQTGWQQYKGKWYYFRKVYGDMACSEYVNGYWLGEDGVWNNEAQMDWHEDEIGWKYYNDAGVCVQDTSVTIDGKIYAFDENGYRIDE